MDNVTNFMFFLIQSITILLLYVVKHKTKQTSFKNGIK